MTELEEYIFNIVKKNMETEKLSNSIIYLNHHQTQGGENLHIGDINIEVPWNAHIVFIDLEPGVNWGHKCCYFVVGKEPDKVKKVAAQMPPFLKAGTSSFHYLWHGHLAPEWAIRIDED